MRMGPLFLFPRLRPDMIPLIGCWGIDVARWCLVMCVFEDFMIMKNRHSPHI